MWSCLDGRSNDGPVVNAIEGVFFNTGRGLASWLRAWLDGVDLGGDAMFEPGPSRTMTNPFTKKPIVMKGRGKPTGEPWP